MVVSSIIAGASGGALANVALSPLGGGAGMLQSYWYGAGLILGERMMYTFHWEKINTRIKKGEDFLSVLESEMNPAITAIANYSLTIMKKTGAIYMQGGIDFMAQLIENMFKLVAGENITDTVITGETQPPVQCPSGFRWSASAQQCVPEDIPEPTPMPTPTPEPTPTPTPEPITEPTPSSHLQNFSDIPTTAQSFILARMQQLNILSSRYMGAQRDGNTSLALRYLTDAKVQIDMWKQTYISLKGYKNPTPWEQIPYINDNFRNLLRGWTAFL